MRFIYTKTFAIFAACLVVVVILVFMQVKGWLDPVRTAVLEAPRPIVILVEDITLPLKNFFGTIYQLNKITKENYQLRSQVISLQQSLVQENEQSLENEALKKELGFVKSSQFSLAPCTVLSENAFSLDDALVLNCGTDDGVAAGSAVVSQGYLVGKIIYSGKNSSTVLLVTSSQFSTDAKISQNSATAIVSGSFGSGLILDQVPQAVSFQPGWLVVTAGINQQIPKNILIGQIGDTLSSGSDLFKRAALTSPIDFNNLDFVFVVKQ